MSQRQSYNSGQGRRSRPAFSYPQGNRSRSGGSRIKKAYIDPSKFVQTAKPRTEEAYTPENHFDDFLLDARIKQNLAKMHFVSPSPIQDQAIPAALTGRDIVGIANTGTGKTAAFAVPVLQRLLMEPGSKAIILAPTRELAEQIEQQCRVIGKGTGLNGALLIGGTSMGPQFRDLERNPRIIIGTPGRIKDHLERGSLNIDNCNMVVLDEVDRMLDMGFIHDITDILRKTMSVRQSFYFSATLDSRVRQIIETFSRDPVHISVKSGETSENIEQDVVVMRGGESKLDKLGDILNHSAATKTIIFDDTHRSVEKLSDALVARGFSSDSIHGGKSQSQRQRVLRRFKNSEISILVATDVAARGLDVSDISHVINFSVPSSYDDYVHRIGRTGRAGNIGFALTFIER